MKETLLFLQIIYVLNKVSAGLVLIQKKEKEKEKTYLFPYKNERVSNFSSLNYKQYSKLRNIADLSLKYY